jgi:hypothetical protein
MPKKKTKIFLSHITEEAELATAFKTQIKECFLGLVDVFQSSDSESNKVGQHWLNNITDALRDCDAIIVLCSPYSVTRPWINFECGAGWSRTIEVVPICHSGLRPVDLPVPLSFLQGVDATDPSGLSQVFEMIAGKLQASSPKVDTKKLAEIATAFSEKYVEETEISKHLRAIQSNSVELINALGKLQPSKVTVIESVRENLLERCRGSFEALQKQGHLSFNYSVNGIGLSTSGGGGNFGNLTIKIEPKLAASIHQF